MSAEQVKFIAPPVDIPMEKLEQMKEHARKLMQKYPHWKLSKVQRKTAEYFRVKIMQ